MTITTPAPSLVDDRLLAPAVALDLYRDIHKGIRAELFAVTEQSGRIDPTPCPERAALADHVGSVVALLVTHAEHEDGAIQPVLEQRLPVLAEGIEADHERLEARIHRVHDMALSAAQVPDGTARFEVHRLYLELASFTSAYLEHQDVEERVVMPALEAAIGVEAVGAIHGQIISNIPPDELATSLALMLPAMNVEDRCEMLGGMRAGAPAEVFDGIWSLAGSVLTDADRAAVAVRLGMC